MNKQTIKIVVVTSVITAVVLSTAYLGYVFYKSIKLVQVHEATLQYLNANFEGLVIQAVNKAQQKPAQK